MEEEKKGKIGKIFSWILAAAALVYDLSPVDIVPDAAIGIGWLDDILITGVAILNLIQHNSGKNKPKMAKIAKSLKWGCAIFAIIGLAVLALSTYGLIKLFS